MSENISAFTPPGTAYPPYVSINERDQDVEITVRSPASDDGRCGNVSAISLSRDDFDKLIAECSVWLAERGR